MIEHFSWSLFYALLQVTIAPSVPLEEIPGIHLIPHIIQHFIIAVRNDSTALLLELLHIIHHQTAEESGTILQRRLVNDNLCPFGLNTLHNPLDTALAEIIGVRFHGEAIHADYYRKYVSQLGNMLNLPAKIVLLNSFSMPLLNTTPSFPFRYFRFPCCPLFSPKPMKSIKSFRSANGSSERFPPICT